MSNAQLPDVSVGSTLGAVVQGEQRTLGFDRKPDAALDCGMKAGAGAIPVAQVWAAIAACPLLYNEKIPAELCCRMGARPRRLDQALQFFGGLAGHSGNCGDFIDTRLTDSVERAKGFEQCPLALRANAGNILQRRFEGCLAA